MKQLLVFIAFILLTACTQTQAPQPVQQQPQAAAEQPKARPIDTAGSQTFEATIRYYVDPKDDCSKTEYGYVVVRPEIVDTITLKTQPVVKMYLTAKKTAFERNYALRDVNKGWNKKE